jgi:hypothetical protein
MYCVWFCFKRSYVVIYFFLSSFEFGPISRIAHIAEQNTQTIIKPISQLGGFFVNKQTTTPNTMKKTNVITDRKYLKNVIMSPFKEQNLFSNLDQQNNVDQNLKNGGESVDSPSQQTT